MSSIRLKGKIRSNHGCRGRNSAEAFVIDRLGILERQDVRRVIDRTPGGSIGILTTAGQTVYVPSFAAGTLGL